ncbi:MAG: molybdate ABC transporter substrate-binding protein [Ardenticatenaceae bacterium]
MRDTVLMTFVLLLLFLTGCIKPQSDEITLFAASSLTDALSEIARSYERKHPNVTVRVNFGGSSQLATQLAEGAPADLFASANETQMQKLVQSGQIAAESVQFFATNRLVLVVPAENPAAITSLADLARPGIKLVTAAKEVPIGQYTRDILAKMEQSADFSPGFEQAVLGNIVSEEANVRQVVTKVQLGEADAAMVYRSDVRPNQPTLQTIPIPEAYNVQAYYPIAPLHHARQKEGAANLLAFILSAQGQAILHKWGVLSP